MNPSHPLPEAIRLQYLDAMGVSSWLPVQASVGGAGPIWQAQAKQVNEALKPNTQVSVSKSAIEVDTSQHAMEKQTATPVDEPPPLGITATAAQEQAQAMRDSLLQENMVPETKTKPVVAETVAAKPKSDDLIEPLHLSYSWYSEGVLVINEIPLQDGAAMTASLAQLQTAMVNALKNSKAVMPQAQGEFHWPLVPGAHGDQTQTGAQQALHYQLQKLLKDKPIQQMLLMGQRCAELLPAGINQPSKVFTDKQWPGVQILMTHSLHQLLKIPANKAEAWAHMQPLLATNDG
ncbi:MAG: hypothetical protein ACPIA3_04265 [Pseudomonadales bacterium]